MLDLYRLWIVLRTVLRGLARIALLCILGFTVVDVGGRYLFGLPLEGTTTLIVDLFFPAVVFLSLAYVAEQDGHVRVELVWGRLGPHGRRIVGFLFALLIAAFWLVIAWLAGRRAVEAYILDLQPIGSVGVPLFISYGTVALGSLLGAIAEFVRLLVQNGPAAEAVAGPEVH